MSAFLAAAVFALCTLRIATAAKSLSSAAILQFDAIDSNTKLGLLISIEANKQNQDEVVSIIAIGPLDRDYFAIGFGSHRMLNTYTIVFHSNGRVEEYLLSSQSRQRKAKKLRKSIKLEYMEQEHNTMSMVITRKARGITNQHYTFDVDLHKHDELDIIFAMSPFQREIPTDNAHSGGQSRLHYHGRYKGTDTLVFDASAENETDASRYDFIDAFITDEVDDEYSSSNDTDSVEAMPMMVGMDASGDDKHATQWGLLAAAVIVFVCMAGILLLSAKYCNRKASSADTKERIGISRDLSVNEHCALSPINAVITELDASELWLDANDPACCNHFDEQLEERLNRVISEDQFVSRSKTKQLIPVCGNDDGDNDNIEEEVISDRSDAASVQM